MPNQMVSSRCVRPVVALGERREPGRVYRFTRAQELALARTFPGAFERIYPGEEELPGSSPAAREAKAADLQETATAGDRDSLPAVVRTGEDQVRGDEPSAEGGGSSGSDGVHLLSDVPGETREMEAEGDGVTKQEVMGPADGSTTTLVAGEGAVESDGASSADAHFLVPEAPGTIQETLAGSGEVAQQDAHLAAVALQAVADVLEMPAKEEQPASKPSRRKRPPAQVGAKA